jgi:hypothetical protein
MRTLKLYLDTSIINFLLAGDAPDYRKDEVLFNEFSRKALTETGENKERFYEATKHLSVKEILEKIEGKKVAFEKPQPARKRGDIYRALSPDLARKLQGTHGAMPLVIAKARWLPLAARPGLYAKAKRCAQSGKPPLALTGFA